MAALDFDSKLWAWSNSQSGNLF